MQIVLGQKIEARRRHFKVTQQELATRCGVSRAHIAKIETDGDLPSISLLKTIMIELAMPEYMHLAQVLYSKEDVCEK